MKAFRSGAVDYISKPFKFEEVHAHVETHLELHVSVAKNPSIYKIRKFHDLRTCAWMVLKVVDGGCDEQVTFVSYP